MENLIKGLYFKSENDISSRYILSVNVKKHKTNAVLTIYEISTLLNAETGDEITIDNLEIDIDLICTVDLWGKYFFPVFENHFQMYYDDEKYYQGKQKTNSITSMFEAINYGIDYGLNKAEIKPY